MYIFSLTVVCCRWLDLFKILSSLQLLGNGWLGNWVLCGLLLLLCDFTDFLLWLFLSIVNDDLIWEVLFLDLRWKHDLNFAAHDTLFEEDVSDGNIDEVLAWLTR